MRGVEMAAVGQVLNVAHCGIALQLVDRIQPVTTINRFDMRQQFQQDFPQVADQRNIDFDILVDLRRIDLDVYLFCIGRVSFQRTGDAIVEAHAKGQQQVGFLDRVIDPGFSVHAHHAEIQRVRRGQRAQAKERECNRDAGALGKIAHLAHRSGNDDAVPGKNHGPLRIVN